MIYQKIDGVIKMSNKNININFGNLQENNPLYLSKLSSFSLTEFNLDGIIPITLNN